MAAVIAAYNDCILGIYEAGNKYKERDATPERRKQKEDLSGAALKRTEDAEKSVEDVLEEIGVTA